MTFIKKRLIDVYKQFVTTTLNLELNEPVFVVNKKTSEVVDFFEGPIADAFDMYILLISLADLLKPYGEDNPAEQLLHSDMANEIELNAMDFFKRNTGTVEVFFQDRLVRVYFPVAPTCRNISKLSRTQLMMSV